MLDFKHSSKSQKYDLCIVGGAGRVGLPLAVVFALKGVKTVIYDLNKEALSQISAGVFPFKENQGPESLKQALENKTLFTSDSAEAIKDSKLVLLVVGTPIDEYLNPDFKAIMGVIKNYFDYFSDDQVLILRSTVYPGTSKKVQKYFEGQGKKIKVAFCPERIAEGKAIDELMSLPQIISAFDQNTEKVAYDLFNKITDKLVTVKPMEAELAKLFTNAWRYISFAASNQFYMIAESFGADYGAIYQAMTQDYDRAKNLPGAGFAAGPCLLKDTMQISAFSNNNFSLGQAAMLVNEGLPKFVIEVVKKKLQASNSITKLGYINVGILGMAFKRESDNKRDSLSYKLKKIAEFEFGTVRCHDVYIKDEALLSLDEVLDKSDVVILATPHKDYKKIDPKKYPKKIFIDVWGFWR
ncbi:MAG: hypothetical protein A2744_02345 [Candidatus Buchananbacteria bacterium RIFCSPHIGHO2_01_FULL_44_11]|uniref:UDP-glucose/GDP-mannose dehydrogenase C-terminal domain-containing protein n=1 Tax=Candidatus Buchananbacteria bacterium RIFCSPHIGHO2_01_FULL_44_11 TaxID=1797535 RepID=A0A1G1Y0Y4_9BACT|nr:MAG: hypothetical protein A2744_02345 [Candidatus Buchananbacteria bacterium RIFCSPHIGHO2_01_FULL_44_11]